MEEMEYNDTFERIDKSISSCKQRIEWLEEVNKELLTACKLALVQIKQDNDERNVKDDYRGTEWHLKGVIAKIEGE